MRRAMDRVSYDLDRSEIADAAERPQFGIVTDSGEIKPYPKGKPGAE